MTKKSAFTRSVLRLKFISSTRFGRALDVKQCCMKTSFISHYLLKLSSLFGKKVFCGIQTYSCDFSGITKKMEKKSERGVKGTKNKLFPPKEGTLASSISPPSPSFFLIGAM